MSAVDNITFKNADIEIDTSHLRYDNSLSCLRKYGLVIGKLPVNLIDSIEQFSILNLLNQEHKKRGKAVFSGIDPTNPEGSLLMSSNRNEVRYESIAACKGRVLKSFFQALIDNIFNHECFPNSEGSRRAVSSLQKDGVVISVLQSFAETAQALPQCTHTDYSAFDVEELFYKGVHDIDLMPLLCIVALEDETFFEYAPSSHRKLLGERSGILIEYGVIMSLTRLVLQKGEFILFHPLLIHRGAKYSRKNTRIHLYLDSPVIQRKEVNTYIVVNDSSMETNYVKQVFGNWQSECYRLLEAKQSKKKRNHDKGVALRAAKAAKRSNQLDT